MSETIEAEARLYNHTDRLLQGHRRLLGDRERNRLFYEALRACVESDSAVLDIGSGTGVWAVAAALLGARRVVAIEYEPLLLGVIRALAEENGVADRVEIISGDSRQIALDREFDIVISETIGHLVFDESIASIMTDARERFLKPGGLMIPQAVSLHAAAARLEGADEKLPAGIPLAGAVFESLAINIPLALTDKTPLTLLSEPQTLISTDLRTVGEMPDLSNLSARWDLKETGAVNCFAVWAEAVLTEKVSVTTYRTTSWMPMIYRIKPFRQQSGVVEFKLTLTDKSNYWTVNLSGSQSVEEQSHSPAAAATELLTRSRPFSKALEHLAATLG